MPLRARTCWTLAVAGGAALAVLGTLNTVRNLRVIRRAPGQVAVSVGPRRHAAPRSQASLVPSDPPRVSVLLPLRNEAHRVQPCLWSLAHQTAAEFIVLDDNSTDGTAEVVRRVLGADPRLRLVREEAEPPAGWLGKPWACQRLADLATGDLLVFLDADVTLSPGAVARLRALMVTSGADLLCPYPTQVTHGLLGRLVQPLLQWSWLTTLPLDVAERSSRPTTAAGNGQLLAVWAQSYAEAGGHGAVRGEVLEDVALVRAVKAIGGRAGMADGTDLAICDMYDDDAALVRGYAKSLWAAFGSPAGALATTTGLVLTYVVPGVAAITGPDRRTRLLGILGYTAGVAGRTAVARRMGQHVWPDVVAHPVSILAFTGLVAESWRRKRAGTLQWSGRAVTPAAPHPAPDGRGAAR